MRHSGKPKDIRLHGMGYKYRMNFDRMFVLFFTEACSSRSTPKPRPPSPTARPNITFHTYACPPAYAKWYCLNGATCFTVKIGESLLYNCEWVFKTHSVATAGKWLPFTLVKETIHYRQDNKYLAQECQPWKILSRKLKTNWIAYRTRRCIAAFTKLSRNPCHELNPLTCI